MEKEIYKMPTADVVVMRPEDIVTVSNIELPDDPLED